MKNFSLKSLPYLFISALMGINVFCIAAQGAEIPDLNAIEILNGGDAVICNGGTSKKNVTSLDLYELKFLYEWKVDLGDQSLNEWQKVQYALDKLSNIDPVRANMYHESLAEFYHSHRILYNVNLTEIQDSDHAFLAKNCEAQQLVVSLLSIDLPNDLKYIINGDLWSLMPAEARASTILHEIIYNEAVQYGHNTSFFVRYYNAIISSTKILEFDENRYKRNVLRLLRFPDLSLTKTPKQIR